MSYKLEKPYTDKQKADFIVKYNHNQGLIIHETNDTLFALEVDEIIQDEQPIKNPNYQIEQLEKLRTSKFTEINTAKEQAFKSGFYFNNQHFDCDDRAQTRLSAQLTIANPETEIIWLDYDYKPITFTYDEFLQLCNTATKIVSSIEFLTGQYISAAEIAQTSEEIEKITPDFSTTAINTFLLNQN